MFTQRAQIHSDFTSWTEPCTRVLCNVNKLELFTESRVSSLGLEMNASWFSSSSFFFFSSQCCIHTLLFTWIRQTHNTWHTQTHTPHVVYIVPLGYCDRQENSFFRKALTWSRLFSLVFLKSSSLQHPFHLFCRSLPSLVSLSRVGHCIRSVQQRYCALPGGELTSCMSRWIFLPPFSLPSLAISLFGLYLPLIFPSLPPPSFERAKCFTSVNSWV